ncbi:MAG: bifunctional demethylmenaquinone methyltransferase/2-methoxy-6-polyprenyl-1,4-benzoquinol methylase UbiE [Porphyromonadaceae bacterium]|nr:MAG: bifunctional demethylmenaquinone methyltransferase/2-methoxy-6-polyprenyl-1,4-benzoquinol methylase UbiE [Porphyromonadaceae bacterium]
MKTNESRENSEMFDQIAGSYDFLNHMLSLNFDKGWRRKAISTFATMKPRRILDVATGTADMAIGAVRLNPDQITGVDVSTGMLEIGRKKILDHGLADRITLIEAACEALPFEEYSFDAAMVAFGVRNFKDPELGLREIYRVLSPGGKLAILEFSLPRQKWLRNGYRFYFHRLVPAIGRWFSRDLSAYRYLPDSVEAFPKGEAFVAMLNRAGFTSSAYKPLSSGICGLYTGIKKNN